MTLSKFGGVKNENHSKGTAGERRTPTHAVLVQYNTAGRICLGPGQL